MCVHITESLQQLPACLDAWHMEKFTPAHLIPSLSFCAFSCSAALYTRSLSLSSYCSLSPSLSLYVCIPLPCQFQYHPRGSLFSKVEAVWLLCFKQVAGRASGVCECVCNHCYQFCVRTAENWTDKQNIYLLSVSLASFFIIFSFVLLSFCCWHECDMDKTLFFCAFICSNEANSSLAHWLFTRSEYGNPVISIHTFIKITLLNLPNRNIVQNYPHSLYSARRGMYAIL